MHAEDAKGLCASKAEAKTPPVVSFADSDSLFVIETGSFSVSLGVVHCRRRGTERSNLLKSPPSR